MMTDLPFGVHRPDRASDWAHRSSDATNLPVGVRPFPNDSILG
jgi:hypothetical protein